MSSNNEITTISEQLAYPICVSLEHTENKISDCAYMECSAEVINENSILLKSNLLFGEYTAGITGGVVRVSLKKVQLSINLKGCAMEIDKRSIRNFFQTNTYSRSESTIEKAHGESSKEIEKIGGKISIKDSSISSRGEVSKESDENVKFIQKQSYDKKYEHINFHGSKFNPILSIDTPLGEEYIRGEIPINQLGIVTIELNEGLIDLELKCTSSDINISGVEGLWPKNISRKKSLIIRVMVLRQIKCKPYLSKTSLSFYRDTSLV